MEAPSPPDAGVPTASDEDGGTPLPPPDIDDSADYLDTLPEVGTSPQTEVENRAIGGARFGDATDGERVCSTTRYEIRSAPDDVVIFNSDPQVFWPGALIQGDSYANGSPKLIPLPGRAPLNISISGLFADASSAFDVTPTQSAVNDAVGGLLSSALQDGTPSTQQVSYRQREAYSFEQAALSLGFSARYLGAKVKGGLSYNTTSEQNTVVANATIRTFTISVDPPSTPSAFFDGLDPDDLEEQVALGRLSEDNLPVYVASVTYGQIMMFSATSSESMTQLKAALSASFNSFSGGASASLRAEQQSLLQESSIQVVTLGGSAEGVAGLIQGGAPAEFFKGATVVTSSVPIAYTLKDLHGNVVKLGETASYDLTTCNPSGFANYYVGNNGSGEVLGYYADGSETILAEAIADSSHPILDLVVDSANDRLYTLHQDGPGSEFTFLRAYEANGQRPMPGLFDGYGSDSPSRINELFLQVRETSLSYDPQNARLYLTGTWGGCEELHLGVARTRNLDGDLLPTCFDVPLPDDVRGTDGSAAIQGHDSVYVPAIDRLFVAVTYQGVDGPYGRIEVFDRRGNRLTEPGTYPGLSDPRAIAYSAKQQRLFVAEPGTDSVHVFDAAGAPHTLAVPFPTFGAPVDLHYDDSYDRLYVVERDASLISVFEPDGREAAGLATPYFPGVNKPAAIAWRP